MSSISDDGENEGFLPMAFDPNPARRPSIIPRKRVPQANEVSPIDPPPPRDYFTGRPPSKAHRDVLRDDRPSSSRSASTERESSLAPQSAGQPKASPHIAYQEKGRALLPRLLLLQSVVRRRGRNVRKCQRSIPALSRLDGVRASSYKKFPRRRRLAPEVIWARRTSHQAWCPPSMLRIGIMK
jgi:hypothetical protein